MKKKLLLILLTFSMLLPLFSGMTFVASAAGNAAKIGNTEYASLGEAVTAAAAGDTITLLADSTYADTIALNKDITIDGAGKTVTYTGTASAFSVSANAALKNMTVQAANGGGFHVTSGSLALGERDKAESAVTVNASGISEATAPLYTSGSGKPVLNLYYAELVGFKRVIALAGASYELNIYGGEYAMTCQESDVGSALLAGSENGGRLIDAVNASAANPDRAINIYGGEYYSDFGYACYFAATDLVINVYNGYFSHSGDSYYLMVVRSNAQLNIFGGIFSTPELRLPFRAEDSNKGGAKIIAYSGTVIFEGNNNGMQPIARETAKMTAPKIYGMTVIHSESLSDIDELQQRPDIRPVIATGASLLVSSETSGIRFSATMPNYVLGNVNSIKDADSEVSYGMLILQTSKLEGLPVLNFDTVNYLGLKEGEDYANITVSETYTGEYGDTAFDAELRGIAEKDYGADYSANAYVKFKLNGIDVYAFSNYSEANTRNIKDIASRALADNDENALGYTAEQIAILEKYANTTYVENESSVTRVLCLNALAKEALGDYTFYSGQGESDYTFAKRLAYIQETVRYSDPDIMLFQEWSGQDYWGKHVKLEGSGGRYTSPQFPGFEWVNYGNRRGVPYEKNTIRYMTNYGSSSNGNAFDCHNFVVYSTEKFEYVDSGSRFISKSGTNNHKTEDLLFNSYSITENKGSAHSNHDDLGDFTWVVLKDKATGLKSIYVSTHTYQGSHMNSSGNSRNAYFLENLQAVTEYLQGVSAEHDNAPVIIGGDFNMPTYGGRLMYQYNHLTQVANYRDAKVTGSDSGTARNFGETTAPRMGASNSDIKIDYIFANGADTYGYEVLAGQILADGKYDPFAQVGSTSQKSEGYDISDHLPVMTDVVIRRGQNYEAYDPADNYSNPETKNDTVISNASGTGSTATNVIFNNESARAAVKVIKAENGAQYMQAQIVNDAEKGNVLRISVTDETNYVNIAFNYSELYTTSLADYSKIRVTYKTVFTYEDTEFLLRASTGTTLGGSIEYKAITGTQGEWQTMDISVSGQTADLTKVGFMGYYKETGLLKGDAIYIASIELIP